jgi:hypothetical protein
MMFCNNKHCAPALALTHRNFELCLDNAKGRFSFQKGSELIRMKPLIRGFMLLWSSKLFRTTVKSASWINSFNFISFYVLPFLSSLTSTCCYLGLGLPLNTLPGSSFSLHMHEPEFVYKSIMTELSLIISFFSGL